MKKNVPKFLIAKNEAASPGAAYIVHTQDPSFIAEIKTFSSSSERDEYISENKDKDIITVNQVVIIEQKRYLESPEGSKGKTYLVNKLRHWVIANFLNRDVF